MHAPYDMQGEIHCGTAAAAGDALTVIDKEIRTDFDVGIQLSQRVDMLVMGGGTLAFEKACLGQDEGTGIERTQGGPGARPSMQGAVQWSAVVCFRRPTR